MVLLDQYPQTEQLHTPRWPRCPEKGHVVTWRDTGQVASWRCGKLRCHACLVPEVLDRAAAISLARPRHFVTLTRVGPQWASIRSSMLIFLRSLRRSLETVEAVYHVEANPAGTGNHVHIWARAAQLHRAAVSSAARQAGFGAVLDVRPVALPPPGHRLQGTTYGMKACLQRPTGATTLWPAAKQYLSLNGERLEHHTRHFYVDRTGAPVGVRQAISEARRQYGLSGGWSTF